MIDYPIFNPEYDTLDSIPINCNLLSPHEFVGYREIDSESKFSMFHINIRSCRSNFAKLHLFLQTLVFTFYVIILTETWLSEDCDFLFELDGYKSHSLYRNNHGGGIKLYVREDIEFKILNQLSFINDLYECLSCELFLFSKNMYSVLFIARPIPMSYDLLTNLTNKFYHNFLVELIQYCAETSISIFLILSP